MEITHKQLGINPNTNVIHVDNYEKPQNEAYKNFCGTVNNSQFNFLLKENEKYPLKICKTCSKIYYKKFHHTLESFLIVLKLKGQLFIN